MSEITQIVLKSFKKIYGKNSSKYDKIRRKISEILNIPMPDNSKILKEYKRTFTNKSFITSIVNQTLQQNDKRKEFLMAIKAFFGKKFKKKIKEMGKKVIPEEMVLLTFMSLMVEYKKMNNLGGGSVLMIITGTRIIRPDKI